MKTKYLLLISLFIGISLSQSFAQKRNKVLILGIDGCRPDALLYANTPNIDKLWKSGAYSFRSQTDPISSSGICWTGMLTGVWHEKHNVISNSYKNPNLEEYPHFFKRVKEQKPELKLNTIVNWAPIHKILQEGDADVVENYSPDDKVAERVAEIIEDSDVDALFVQLDDTDHAGHTHDFSLQSGKYITAIEKADSLVGIMVDAINNRPHINTEDWYIIVSADHGGSNFSHGKDILSHTTIFYIITGKNVKKGEIQEAVNIVDIPITAMKILGVDIKDAWLLDGTIKGLKND